MNTLLAQNLLILFAILAIGSWIGQLSFKGFSLGAAGVLFTALVFGHFGFSVPKEIMDLGLLLFVYAVGLQAGPRFFRTFQRHGMQFVIIAVVTVGAGALAAVGVAYSLDLPPALASGLYTGALTCTPALAAAVDAIEKVSPGSSGMVSVGYSLAYPLSMAGIVLLVQLMPRLLRRDLRQEERRWLEEKRSESPPLEARQFRISNPNCDGKKVSEINPHRMTQANISRLKRGERVFAATPDAILRLGDVVMAVGTPEELEKLRLLLGEETHEPMDVNAEVLSTDVEVTETALTGKKLGQMRVWERYTVVITRIRRQGLEIAPTGDVALEMGDNLRVVGDKAAVEEFVRLVHGHPQRADETQMLPFLIGLLLGVILGAIPINLPNGIQVKLGSAGGAFLVSLLVGHFGGIGPLRLHVPTAAMNLSRELGLILFLAGAGTTAGAQFVQVLEQQGISLLLGGLFITAFSVLAGLLLMHRFYRMNLLSTMGALTACMTNPPGLGAANAQTETDLPTLSYASAYPVALIFKIVLAQLLAALLILK
jgi:putative transport protein